MPRNLLLILFLFSFQYVVSQNDSITNKDLKIGLVLSGGGAKGFAHIGVIKVLEEAGIRIDYIGGTSMGAIVGALYASGYSPQEMDSIITSLNFTELMQDKLPRRSKSIYQKENTEKYAITLPLKNGNLALPSAISKGQNVFNMLSRLTEHVHGVHDFSKLPIPFFCVATNLETGGMEVLDKGFLPEAIRASGSFPTLLNPVDIDGKILVDGAVVNNFPVDIMKERGVDLIIGVDVQDKLRAKGNLDTAPKIIMQIVSFQMYDAIDLKRKQTDLYLHPDISDYSVVSFDLAEEIIDKGEEVARKQLKYLKEVGVRQKTKSSFVKSRMRPIKRDTLQFDKISILGNKNYTDEYILGKLKLNDINAVSYLDFNEGIDNLAATDNFKSIQYRFLQQDNGLELQFSLKEEEISTFLQFGIHYDDLYKTGALINITSKHAIFKNDVLSADFILGDNIRYKLDYFIDNGFNWSYGISTRYNQFDKSFFINPDPESGVTVKVPIEYNDFTSQLFLQTSFNQTLALRLGAEHQNLRVFTENLINNEVVKNYFDNSNYFNAFATVTLDTYDDKDYPKKGMFLFSEYKAYLISSDFNGLFTPYSQLKGKLSGAFTIGDKFTTHIVSEAGVTIGNGDGNFDYFLGGNNQNFVNNFIPFYGYDVGDLSDRAFLKSSVTFRYEFFKNNYTIFTANAARVEEDLFNGGSIFADTRTGYAAGYSLKSPIGPVTIQYSWSPDTEQNFWFFNIGFWF